MTDGLRWEKWTDGRYHSINWGAQNITVICHNCHLFNCNNCNCNEQDVRYVNNFHNKQTDSFKNRIYLIVKGL